MEFKHTFRTFYDESTGEVRGEHRCSTEVAGQVVSYAEEVELSVKAGGKDFFSSLIDGPTRKVEVEQDDPAAEPKVDKDTGKLVPARKKIRVEINNRTLMEDRVRIAALQHAAALAGREEKGVARLKLSGTVGAVGNVHINKNQ